MKLGVSSNKAPDGHSEGSRLLVLALVGDDLHNIQKDREVQLPKKIKTFAQASKECTRLDQKALAEHSKRWDRAKVESGYDVAFASWAKEHGKLRSMVNALARERAETTGALNMKAMVIASTRDAFDDPGIWLEKLQESLMADIARNAKAVA
jgi:hypothetical protein